MEIGVDSFAAAISDPVTGQTIEPVDRMQQLLAEIEHADKVGLDVFGIGEHHREEFLDSAPTIILAAAVLKVPDLFANQAAGLPQAIVGAVCAGATAFVSVRFLLKYFETETLKPFAYYCMGAGLGAFVYLVL